MYADTDVSLKFVKLVHIMKKLRAPGGCPWDREQNYLSLRRYIIEEAYEQLRKAAAMSEKEKDNEHVYRKEPYVFDFDRMKFMVDGKEIELSKTEQKLLRILVENAGMNMRRELLLDRVWSDGAEYVDENALSVSIKRLRDKLGAEHAIRTVYGIGYRWE